MPSRCPNSRLIVANIVSRSGRLLTSARTARLPAPSVSLAACSDPSFKPQMATRAPSLSNSCAAASPIPLLPPVIRIFLFASLLIVVTPCAPVETGIGVENESLRKPRTTTLCSREVGRGRSVRPYPWVHAPPLWLRLDPVGRLGSSYVSRQHALQALRGTL